MNKKLFLALLAVCLALTTGARANAILTLDPADGAITGLAGTTVGWGFTFTNDTDYALITGSEFCDVTSTSLPDVCLSVAPDLGTYTDFAGSIVNAVGPLPDATSVSQTFDNDPLNPTGIGSFAIDASASGTASGLLVLTYDLYSVSPDDPNFNFDDEISGNNFVSASASVTVGSVTATPEPGYLPLLAVGLLSAMLLGRRSRHKAHCSDRNFTNLEP
jgi:hypothetical protein